MRQLWIVLFFGFFLVFGSIYAFLMARHMGATDRTVDDINWVSPQDCFGCSESDAERFGAGRAAGSDVQMPYHSHSPASATVTVTFTEACDYCSVPIAVTERVALAVEELECLGSAFLELNLVSPRELDVMVAQELIAGFTTTRLTSRVHQKDESWRVALLTDIVPTVLVTDKKSQVVAQWIGFDPGHAPDLFESILQALHCEAGPYAVQEHSAIAAASRGEPIPDWIIRDTSTITAQPAVYIFSDTNCALCVELREATWEAVEPYAETASVVYIDSTPSKDLIGARWNHVEYLMSSTTDAFLRERLVRVHEQMTLPMVDAATIRRTSSMSLPVNILSFQDGYRRAATSLVHGTTPSAVTMDSDGRLVERLVFQGGESKDDYLQRLVSAVKAVIE